MTTNLWTWGGTYFGYRDGDDLWTHNGRHVGRFYGDEVYASDGRYLGELKNGKLIKRSTARSHRRAGFHPHAPRVGRVPYVDHVGTIMYVGYEDFPGPENFA
jgi:hypothetical protein